jgi:hypothetical protein
LCTILVVSLTEICLTAVMLLTDDFIDSQAWVHYHLKIKNDIPRYTLQEGCRLVKEPSPLESGRYIRLTGNEMKSMKGVTYWEYNHSTDPFVVFWANAGCLQVSASEALCSVTNITLTKGTRKCMRGRHISDMTCIYMDSSIVISPMYYRCSSLSWIWKQC